MAVLRVASSVVGVGGAVATTAVAPTAEAAQAAADGIGYPVALKILSPAISHKSDVGGVVLDVGDPSTEMRFDAVLVAPGKIPRHIPAAFEAG